MSDPVVLTDEIARDANQLDEMSKALYLATEELDAAEQVWEARLDEITRSLEEEFAEAGRKSVPEHTALSAARRAHRGEYVAWRTAKRRVDRLQQQLRAKAVAMSGRQSNLKALSAEANAYGQAPVQPQGAAVHTFGARRAA